MFARSLVTLAIALSASASPLLGNPAASATAAVGLGDDSCPGGGSTVTVTVTVGGGSSTATGYGGGGYGGSGSSSSVIDVPTTTVAIPTTTAYSAPYGGNGGSSATAKPTAPSGGSGSGSSGSGSGSGNSDPGSATCNSGPVQCCNQVQPANSVNFASILPSSLLGLLPINLQGLNVPIGLDCDPINVLGIGSNSCSQQTVCCENNNFSGLIAIGCTPINLSL